MGLGAALRLDMDSGSPSVQTSLLKKVKHLETRARGQRAQQEIEGRRPSHHRDRAGPISTVRSLLRARIRVALGKLTSTSMNVPFLDSRAEQGEGCGWSDSTLRMSLIESGLLG
jgi:hypothetical protein